ncbi:MAG: hypothetical protein GY953_17045, partial [bacterium]|nr:hypothetical protein [bacterium]
MSTDSMSTKFRVPPPACGSLTAPGDGEGARQRAWRRRRRKGLLTLARRNPHRVLKDRRCHKPEFCREFLDLCDGKALEQPRKALKFAPVATELAEKVGDRHLIHRARGIFVHAYIARRRWK